MKVISATLNAFEGWGGSEDFYFTEERLQAMANTSAGKLIRADFDDASPVMGTVLSAIAAGGRLELDVELSDKAYSTCKSVRARGATSYIVPCVELPSYSVLSFGLTTKPVDKTLPGF